MIPMPWGNDDNKLVRGDKLVPVEDPLVDDTELALVGTNLLMTSSVFGFPDFGHLVELQDGGSLRWYGGLSSQEPGNWCLVRGDPKEGEREEDLFLELTHKLTDVYKEAFSVTSGSCFWRGKLELKEAAKGGQIQQVRIEGGIVVSQKEGSDKDFVREGVWTAADVDEEGIAAQRQKAREAVNRALMTPKAESTGFKTPARIAGIRRTSKKMLAQPDEDDPSKLLTDD
jgi:hypothetical protein